MHFGWLSDIAQGLWAIIMMTSSNGNIFCVTGPGTSEFPAHRPVTRSFGVFFDLRLNKRLSIQSWGWRIETLPRPLWYYCIDKLHYQKYFSIYQDYISTVTVDNQMLIFTLRKRNIFKCNINLSDRHSSINYKIMLNFEVNDSLSLMLYRFAGYFIEWCT